MIYGIKPLIFLVLFTFSHIYCTAQFAIGFSLSGIGYHPKQKKNASFYKWKLDKNGRFVAYLSATFFASYRFNNYVGVKFQQSLVIHDCAGKFAGVSHIGLDLHDDIIGWKNLIHEFSASIGPFWYYRKNWSQIKEYENDPKFIKMSENKVWEKRFVWYGGQAEYAYNTNANTSYTINILPGHPFLHTFGLGGRIKP